MQDLIAALLGLVAGVVSAMFGVGGGLIFVPTLIFLGKDSHVAVATSLVAMIPVIVMGSWRQTRYGTVRWHDAVIIGLASVPTAKLGQMTAESLSSKTLQRAFALLLLGVAVQMGMRALRERPSADAAVKADATDSVESTVEIGS